MKLAIKNHLRDFLAILGMLVISIGIALYILAQQGVRIPVVQAGPKHIWVQLSDAQAVEPGQGQTARVAGAEVGKISDVKLENGTAMVRVALEHKYENLVRRDASAMLRPKTPLKDMFLEIDPGNGPVLPEDGTIRSSQTNPDVNPDEIFDALDADTRPYLRILISSGGKGLRGRGEDLRATLKRLEPLHRDLARVTRATASRRHELRLLVHEYAQLVDELGRHPDDLRRVVSSSESVLGALAPQEQAISSSVAQLPGSLDQTTSTLGHVEQFARELRPTLESLRSPIRKLDETNRQVRPFLKATTPVLRDQIRPFVRTARPFTSDLRGAVTDTARAAPDLTKGTQELNRFFNIGAYNPGGAEPVTGTVAQQRARREGFLYWLAWTAQNGVSLFNTADAQGPFRRVTICGTEPANVQTLLGVVLSRSLTEDPALVNQVVGGAGITPQPGSPAAVLSSSQFASCDFGNLNALPPVSTTPLLPLP
jgi:phospholipid/cholesterol/gamma-HCH transport system substrate-binding protein